MGIFSAREQQGQHCDLGMKCPLIVQVWVAVPQPAELFGGDWVMELLSLSTEEPMDEFTAQWEVRREGLAGEGESLGASL